MVQVSRNKFRYLLCVSYSSYACQLTEHIWFAWLPLCHLEVQLLTAESSIENKDWIKMVSNFISTNINEACIDIPQIEAKLIDISIQNQPQVRIL